jgi:chromosome segregation ATPase
MDTLKSGFGSRSSSRGGTASPISAHAPAGQAQPQQLVPAEVAARLSEASSQVTKLRAALAAEVATSSQLKATATELQQRLANLKATEARHEAALQAAEASVRAGEARVAAGKPGSPSSGDAPRLRAELHRLKQEHQDQLKQLQVQLSAAVTAAEEAGHAALAQQQDQLAALQAQLAASRTQAEAAKAAEDAVRAQVAALQERIDEQHAAAKLQAGALDEARVQMTRLKAKAAEHRESCFSPVCVPWLWLGGAACIGKSLSGSQPDHPSR